MKPFAALIWILLAALVSGQTPALDKDRQARSDDIIVKTDQLNLMNQLLPLVMTKEQVRAILPAIEKARQKVKDITRVEYEDLKRIEPKIDAALKSGYDKAAVPDPDLLKEIAGTLAQQVRSFDVMARYGDDAFMMVLPQTGRDGAVEVAERVRATVEQHAWSLTTPQAVTVSLGVATFPRDANATRELVAAAERALKLAKQRGRNCVATPATKAA